MTRRLLIAAGVLITVGALASAGQQGPNPPQKPPVEKGPQNKGEDEIEKARRALLEGNPQGGKPKALILDPVARRSAMVGASITFRIVARNPGLSPSVVLAYSLVGAPEGASIDPETGTFSWTPLEPGITTFFVEATDNGDPARTVRTPVTIEVNRSLSLFGYSFFTSARALIDFRLSVVRSGLTPGTVSRAGNSQAAANLPIVTNLKEGQSQEGAPPKVADLKGSAAPRTEGENAGAMSQTNPGGALQTNPFPNTSRLPLGTNQQPAGAAGSGDNSADALRYFVGPFDMLGLNVFVPAPERYQLGPGDTLTLRVWSPAVEATEVDVKVDQTGQITIPVSGRKVVVRGQTLQQAEQLLKRELRVDLRNGQMTLTLKALRTMSITVLGDAYLPGNYQVPAVATLFNALYMFGGPSDSGSLRQIELRRSDGSVRRFDLYKFLVFGDSKQDVPLQPGDTIWIPPAGPRVTVQGEVARPGIYEAAKGDQLRNLIAFAGGAKATGVLQRVSVETVEPSVGRQLRDVDISATGTPASDSPIFDGDIATVSSVREDYTNAITLEGAVDQPGRYAAVAGTTVADLIAKARGLLPEAYTARADLFRRNADKSQTLIPIDLERALARDPAANPILRAFDRLVIYGIRDVQWMGDRQISIRGAVQRPGSFYRADNMRVVDLLLQAGGLTPDAYTSEMFLQRTEASGMLGPLTKLDFQRVVAGDATMNLVLQDRDVLTVQTITEARFTPDSQVRILGSVQTPGQYPRGSNMRLSDLIKLAGGTLPDAADTVEITNARTPVLAPRTQVSIASVLSGADDPALKDGDLVTIPGRSDIQLTPRKVIIMGAVKQPGPYAVNASTDRLSDLIARAGGFAPNAYPNGAQFFRDPRHLSTVSQERVSPRIGKALQQVDRESYLRAVAKSQIDKARLLNSLGGSSGIALPGLGGEVTNPPVTVPPGIVDQSTVSPARALTEDDLEPGGNINVDLPKALQRKGSVDDVVLQDGDIIVIPDTPTTASVVGAVTVPSAILFVPNKKIDYYITRSGGYVSDAARDQVLLIRYKGLVVKPTARTRVELGDIIWVPTKVIAERLSDKTAEINTISKNVLSGALMFSILRSLIR